MKVTIEKAIYGGAGLARAEGKAIFVPGALPGEQVDVAVRRDKGSFAEADLVSVLSSSPERVEARCPYYGRCGGCQYQHASYDAQLAMKAGVLVETLQRAGLRSLPALQTHSAQPWEYRNRIRLHVDPRTHALGYRVRGSLAILPVAECPIAAPLLQRAIVALAEIAARDAAGAWCAEAELFTNHDSSSLLLSLRQRSGAPAGKGAVDRLCENLRERIPELSGASRTAALAPRGRRSATASVTDITEGEAAPGEVLEHWGAGDVHYQAEATNYRVSLGAFFQGNRFLVDTLRALVLEETCGAHKHDAAWDLFAGVGLFAAALAPRFERVTAVEGSPVSSRDLRDNVPGARAVESSTLSFLERERGKRTAPDAVVLDPPRAGLGVEAATLLAACRSPLVTYVSCDPATLARDLRVFVDSGYTLSKLHLIDMFPQTFHLETIAVLRLR